jgi:signal transduction histidine kinase
MNKLKILSGLLLLSSVSLFSQQVDSLFSLYMESDKGKRIALANEIAQTVYDLQCTDTLYQLTNEISDQLSDAIVYELVACHAMYITVDYALSNQYTLQAALLYEALGDTLSTDIMYGNMANNHLRMGQYEQAIGTFISNKQNNRLAEIYFSMGKLSIKQKNFERAIDLLEQSVAISEALQMRQLLYDSYRLLYEVNREKQSATQALIYLERYKALGDSLFQEATREDLAEFRVRYDTQQKELEIVRQQAEIDKHQNRQYLYIGGLVIAGVLLVLFIYIIRLRNKRNRALAEINATKDKFFSIISHDLKNPAIAQRDALQQLITYAGKWEADSLAQYYEELLKSADGQVELLYNLLNWAQVQTGRMPYVPTEFDLVAELRSDIALIKNMAERKGIALETQMPESAIITGDRNMLATVVRNLLTNAVKFTDKGGCITLEIKPDEEDGYTISVADTGRGMRREEVEGLFRIDRQRSRMGTAGEPGSGLGLIVCQELVEKHGGRLRVESEVGKGSEFLFAVRKKGSRKRYTDFDVYI